jgi:hypothetical protein
MANKATTANKADTTIDDAAEVVGAAVVGGGAVGVVQLTFTPYDFVGGTMLSNRTRERERERERERS